MGSITFVFIADQALYSASQAAVNPLQHFCNVLCTVCNIQRVRWHHDLENDDESSIMLSALDCGAAAI